MDSKCPWSHLASTSPENMRDVMSEELARQIQRDEEEEKEEEKREETSPTSVQLLSDVSNPDVSSTTDSDRLLAELLQAQFDKEYDEMLEKVENKMNGTSKVSISFSNYRKTHPSLVGADDEVVDDDGDVDDDDGDRDDDRDAASDAVVATMMSRRGYVGQGKNITTKHDPQMCGRRNASRVMNFPPEFATGDSEEIDMKLPNHVYNVLKVHSFQETKRSERVKDKTERAVAELSLDPKTRLILYKMVNNETLESVNGCISTGKESTVFHATGGNVEGSLFTKEFAIKVFKTTLTDFKTREKYMKSDHKFKGTEKARPNVRRFIRMWCEKEMHNLNRMKRLGIPCPQVILLKKHVLVMSFIGQDRVAAPKLKDVILTHDQKVSAYSQIVQMMKTLYKGHLIHADLSEYNLLWHHGQIFVIDVSQSVSPQHQHAHEFLLRDCDNIINYFTKSGLLDLPTSSKLFNEVTELNLEGEGQDLLSKIQDYEKNQEMLTFGLTQTGKDFNFDYFYDISARKERGVDDVVRDDGDDDGDDGDDVDDDDSDESDDAIEEGARNESK